MGQFCRSGISPVMFSKVHFEYAQMIVPGVLLSGIRFFPRKDPQLFNDTCQSEMRNLQNEKFPGTSLELTKNIFSVILHVAFLIRTIIFNLVVFIFFFMMTSLMSFFFFLRIPECILNNFTNIPGQFLPFIVWFLVLSLPQNVFPCYE